MRALVKAQLAILGSALGAFSQIAVELVPVEPHTVQAVVDSNAPMFRRNGRLFLFNSTGDPMLSELDHQLSLLSTSRVSFNTLEHHPMWIESVWQAPDGTLYGWYHYERIGVCPNLTAPQIGALVSHDGGRSFVDLGIVLNSGEPVDCSAKNGYFAGGHGDFSVIADRNQQYFYFLFGAYDGDVSGQGISIARMAFGNLDNPIGAVWKYHEGAWSEPGLGGRVTPIFPATVAWQLENTDSFWGPSVHWNTYLERYVVVMNRSCCASEWPQEGIYLTMNADLGDPAGWTPPVKILEAGDWYPWVMGLGDGETSSEAGQRARLYVRQFSDYEIIFRADTGAAPPVEVPPGSEETVASDEYPATPDAPRESAAPGETAAEPPAEAKSPPASDDPAEPGTPPAPPPTNTP